MSDPLDQLDQRLLKRVEQVASSEASATPRFAIVAGISTVLLAGMLFGASLWILVAVAAGLLLGANYYLAKIWATATIARRLGADNDEIKVGSDVAIELEFHNQSRIPRAVVAGRGLVATMDDPNPASDAGRRR